VYAVSTQPADTAKRQAAQQLMATANWVWSGQVAAEFISASTSPKRKPPLSLAAAEQYIKLWLSFPLIPIDGLVVQEALRIAQRFSIWYYDAQVVAAAKQAGCSIMYSEDLNHGQDYDGVRVVNPFFAAP
jgi:predicted nucleic acid-binding protein